MRILAIDMGKNKSVACDYEKATDEHEFQTVSTTPQEFHDLIVKRNPDVVVIEICPAAGWVRDLCEALGKRLVVANTSDEPWRWRKVKRKSDRDDALKAGRLMAMNQINAVHVPVLEVRQWRSLITYRATLIGETTSIKNRIRGILDQMAIQLPSGAKAFSQGGREDLRTRYGKLLAECLPSELWRGIIHLELERMEVLEKQIEVVEGQLAALAKNDQRIKRLKTAPGIGERTAELVVTAIDEPLRFGRGKQVGNYAGLTPKKYQSGNMDHDGKISRGGNGYLRALLVQASWVAIRSHGSLKALYARVLRNSIKRKKKAIVAVARHLFVRLWAMLRDGTEWRDDPAAAMA